MVAKCSERQNALEAGAVRYFTGRPCGRGHVAERRTVSANCLECVRLKRAAWNGGSNDAHNIQVLCAPCNLRKWAHDPAVFAQQIGERI